MWTETEEQAFQQLKGALASAPALPLPDISKPFHLYIYEVRGTAKGVLTQTLGPWERPVAYLSKRLDPVASGWPSCLRAIAATALGQDLCFSAPHAVEALLRDASGRWMSNTRLTQYQTLLLDQPRLRFLKTTHLNPATLLPDDDLNTPLHDCFDLLDLNQMPRPDLRDVPWPTAQFTLFTGSLTGVAQ